MNPTHKKLVLDITSSNSNNMTVVKPKLVIGPNETKLIDLFFPAKISQTMFEEFLFINCDEEHISETHLIQVVAQLP